MDDEKRLELMQQMLSRLRGRPVGRDTPAAASGEAAAEAEPAGPVAAGVLAQDPAAARLRALEELLDRLGG